MLKGMQKDIYFTPETIHAKSLEMLTLLASIRKRHENILIQPGRAALLVLDMQDYFLREGSHAFIPSATAILPNIQMLINIFSVYDRPIIFTRHINSPENAGMMSRWWRDLISASSPDSKIISSLDQSKGIVIRKSQYDAFYKSSLEQTLLANDIAQVVITGVMTHLCCETTARSAFVRGFEVFVTIDGTATTTEAYHRSSLLNLSHGFAVPVLVEEILPAFE